MNSDQEKNVAKTIETIAEHLVKAWNYYATLKALQQHAKASPDILDNHAHFLSTITFALWNDLFLKLAHCSDRRKEASGFPKLFKQLRAYLPDPHRLRGQVDRAEENFNRLQVRSKVENWRSQVIAHHTIVSGFDDFYKKNVCSLDEIKPFINELNALLHVFSLQLSVDQCPQVFCVQDLGPLASQGVDRLVQAMKK